MLKKGGNNKGYKSSNFNDRAEMRLKINTRVRMKAEIKKSVKAAITKQESGVSSSSDPEWRLSTPASSTFDKFGWSRKRKFSTLGRV